MKHRCDGGGVSGIFQFDALEKSPNFPVYVFRTLEKCVLGGSVMTEKLRNSSPSRFFAASAPIDIEKNDGW